VHFREKPPEAALVRFSISPPEKTAFIFTASAIMGPPALSPDGRRLAFNATSADGKIQTWIRSLDTLTAQPLEGTEGSVFPFWSADGRFLGFFAGGKLKKIDASGGPPLTLSDAPSAFGGTWNRDGVIVFSPNGGGPLQKVSAAGGASTPVTSLDLATHETSHRWPWFLPDGRHFLYLAVAGERSSIRVGSLDGGESKPVHENHLNAVYARGYLLFMRETTLMAQPFDARRLVSTGDALPVAEQVMTAAGALHGVFAVSDNGSLVYWTGSSRTTQLAWFDRNGKQTGTLGDPGTINALEFSPDRASVAAAIFDSGSRNQDIWIYDVARGLKTRFTFDPAEERQAAWSPDGRSLVFNSNPKGHFDLFRKQANGVGNEELLFADGLEKYPTSWSPEGKFLLYFSQGDPKTKDDLWVLPMTLERSGEARKPFSFAQTPFNETWGQFSPDGRWIAYQSDESQRIEIYVAPFPGPGGKRQISTAGGLEPRWRQDGKEIYYLATDGHLMAAEVSVKGDVLDVGAVSPLFAVARVGGGYRYDVSSNGQHFLVRTPTTATAAQPLTVVQNWTAALKNK
jgi:Tol biopolymer transport system component